MHIYCLELLAATLAAKTFLKHKTRVSRLLRLDNTIAAAYINNVGETVFKTGIGRLGKQPMDVVPKTSTLQPITFQVFRK